MPKEQTSNKSSASISMDLDNKWSYMKTHGDPGWEEFPTYLDYFVPLVLSILNRLNLKISFFIVGLDASLDLNKEVLGLISQNGHEVANHSFSHEPLFHLYSEKQIRDEILKAETEIVSVTGQKPIGFRGAGFSWSPRLLHVLAENDYLYDATTFPTYLGPIARAYYFANSNLSKQEKRQLEGLYGRFRDGTRSIKPYLWKLPTGGELLELPVSTMPILKIPFHLTYLLYLRRFSFLLAYLYLWTVIRFCRLTRTEPSFLLHPLDIMGADKVPELSYFPAMDMSSSQKIEFFERIIKILSNSFELVPMEVYARARLSHETLRRKKIALN
jgi:hypothetical protein